MVLNAGLLGLTGSLLYFSRKVYSYLISDKFARILNQDSPGRVAGEFTEDIRTRLWGYYYYLGVRPLAGVVIGPLITLFVMAGLATFANASAGCELGVSKAGNYVVYVVSFLGGYSSSDLFDYFSVLGARAIKRLDIR